MPKKVFEYTEDYVKVLEGVYPKQIPDLKGIVGYTSDNIPGVKGVSSAAAPLLSEYQTVEGLYEEIESYNKENLKDLQKFWKESLGINRSPLKALIKESDTELVGKKAALMSKELATIKADIPIKLTLEDIRVIDNEETWKNVCMQLEIKSIV